MLTQNDLMGLFQQNHENPEILNPVRAPSVQSSRKRKFTQIKEIFALNELDILIDEIEENPQDLQDAESAHGLSLRYLITPDRRCLIAKEGEPRAGIPGHGQIATRCISAGNLFVNKENHHVVAVNHQSGDFQPAPQSLVFILQALLATPEIEISPELLMIIEQFLPGVEPQHMTINQEMIHLIENLPPAHEEAHEEVAAHDAGYHTP